MTNISRSKGNQTMKFSQLIECNTSKIFLEKSYTKCGGKTSPRSFPGKLILRISLDQYLKFYRVCFYCIASWGLSKYIETKQQATCFHLIHIKLFKKIKKGLELVSLPSFLHNYWRKIFLLLYSINWPNFIAWLPLLCEIWVNMCIAIVC